MGRNKPFLLALIILLYARPGMTDVLVLVHGYLGNAYSWESPGVVHLLRKQGYHHAGILGYAPSGLVVQSLEQAPTRPLYTVNLPSQAALPVQADWLNAYVQHIHASHPESPITLAAHSAGGVVARLMLVRHKPPGIHWLISIAAPHLGTSRANQALQATHSGGWFGGVKSWLVRRQTGGPLYYTLKRSRGILLDLTPPRPGNLLFWLNRQPHPPIRYTSVIRTGTQYAPGDPVVPPFSQDLCLIPALAEHTDRLLSRRGHLLGPEDGVLLVQLLQNKLTGSACHAAIKHP